MSAAVIADVAAGMLVLAAGAATARLAVRQRDREGRLYGRPRGLRLRWPRRRVPGLPRDDVLLTGGEQAAIAEIEAAAGRRRRRSRG